jgi:hypothetical protein
MRSGAELRTYVGDYQMVSVAFVFDCPSSSAMSTPPQFLKFIDNNAENFIGRLKNAVAIQR